MFQYYTIAFARVQWHPGKENQRKIRSFFGKTQDIVAETVGNPQSVSSFYRFYGSTGRTAIKQFPFSFSQFRQFL
jgi:hypothetical protein